MSGLTSVRVEFTTAKLNCKVTQEMIDDLKNMNPISLDDDIDIQEWLRKQKRLMREKKLKRIFKDED